VPDVPGAGDGRPRVAGRRHVVLHSALLMDRNRIGEMEETIRVEPIPKNCDSNIGTTPANSAKELTQATLTLESHPNQGC